MSGPDLMWMRQEQMAFCMREAYPGGVLNAPDRNPGDFFGACRGEVEYAAAAAAEWDDAQGVFYRDPELLRAAFTALESCASIFLDDGSVGKMGDGNSPYFALVPMTYALVKFKAAGVEKERVEALTAKCLKLYDDAAAARPPVLEYLNPRGLEAVSALWLHRLTGREDLLETCRSRMLTLLEVQYPCGAQPYHIKGWIWGRRPAQVYQLLTVTMMLIVARELKWREIEGYVRRLMDYEMVSTTARGEAIQTPFEGLYKIGQGSCTPWVWPLALALGDEKYLPLAGVTYERWLKVIDQRAPIRTSGRYSDPALGLMVMHMLGVKEFPAYGPFKPAQGIHAFEDISTVFVHEPGVDLGMTVLTGYSSWVEADCGDAKLLALGPELTDDPTYRNFGTDALRLDWSKPTELDKCSATESRAVLRGRGFTKWDAADVKCKDVSQIHTKKLEVQMQYEGREWRLNYRILEDRGQPVSSRILMLLGVFPWSAAPRLTVGDETREMPAAADRTVVNWMSAIGDVVLEAPDGSKIRITPDIPGADRVVVERPPFTMRDGQVVKPANDGFLRVAFDGPSVLRQGKITVRFEPCG